jgi:hypothetical protein
VFKARPLASLSPSLSGCPLQKGGETIKEQPLLILILMVFSLFEGRAKRGFGAIAQSGISRTQLPHIKKAPLTNGKQGFFFV